MIRTEEFLILASNSTHIVIHLEGVLLSKDIPCRIIPLPTEISANCGLSIKVDPQYKEQIKKIIAKENVETYFYLVKKQGLKKEIQKI